MRPRLMQLFLDWLAGTYMAVLLHRVVWAEVLMGTSLPSVWSSRVAGIASVPDWLVYLIAGGILAAIAYKTRASIALLLSGKLPKDSWQRTAALHVACLLLSLTFIDRKSVV